VWRPPRLRPCAQFAVLDFPIVRGRPVGVLTRSIAEIESWSINFYDFFSPQPVQSVVGRLMLRCFRRISAVGSIRRPVCYTARGPSLVRLFRPPASCVNGLLAWWPFAYAIAWYNIALPVIDRFSCLRRCLLSALAANVWRSRHPRAVRTDILTQQAFGIPISTLLVRLRADHQRMRVMRVSGCGRMITESSQLGDLFAPSASAPPLRRSAMVPVVLVTALWRTRPLPEPQRNRDDAAQPARRGSVAGPEPTRRVVIDCRSSRRFRRVQNY